MRKTLAMTLAVSRPKMPSLLWAILAGEFGLTIVLFGTGLVPNVALAGLRLFLRF